jgi:hypothetical protein
MTVTINGTTGVAGVDGTAAAPAIQGNDTNTGIFFPAADTIAFAEGGAEVARFDSSGRLLVGGTTGAERLTVTGNIAVNQTANYIYSNGGSGSAIKSGLYLDGNNNTLIALTNDAERMRIDSSGNLLVGLTSGASYRLDVSSNGTTTARINRSTNTGNLIDFANGGGVLGNISTNGFSIAYNTTSDYRLKDNVVPMTGALDVVSALKPCTFTFKEGGQASQGFIAHELQAVVPDAVTGAKDAVNEDGSINPQGIDTSFLVATLTAAIQEQQAIITDLKSRIEALEQA